MNQLIKVRPRRLRQTEAIRKLVRESHLHPDQIVMPYFVQAGRKIKSSIDSMPGQFRFSPDTLLKELESLQKSGVHSILLFGIPQHKDASASEAYSEKGIVQQTIREIKKNFKDLLIMTDVCLCAYMDHGHCGILNRRGEIENDASLEILARTALSHAEAGADLVAPSDMMDGRVKTIRTILDQNDFKNISIMSYAAKYASAFYGPFRDAAHSAPKSAGNIPKDRKTYQMDSANLKEAMREIALDLKEGADMVMVKPALAYMDVISAAARKFDVPIAAYLVSGEYSMIKAAAAKGWLDEKAAMMEIATGMVRAGANIMITYYAKELASWLR